MTALWGDDANEFVPERWLDGRQKDIHPYQYIPFHAGPRRCLGEKLATPEASVLICKILKKFKFEMTDEQKQKGVRYRKSLTLPINDGLQVNVIKREVRVVIFSNLNEGLIHIGVYANVNFFLNRKDGVYTAPNKLWRPVFR